MRHLAKPRISTLLLAAICLGACQQEDIDTTPPVAVGLTPPSDFYDDLVHYPADYRGPDVASVKESCKPHIQRFPFDGVLTTHLLVTSFGPSTPALASKAKQLEGQIVDAGRSAFTAALKDLARRELPPTAQLEVVEIPCVIETQAEALALAAATEADVVVWGSLSHQRPADRAGKITVEMGDIKAGDNSSVTVGEWKEGDPYYVRASITTYTPQLAGDRATQELPGLTASFGHDELPALAARVRLALAVNLIQRGNMWIPARLFKDPELLELLKQVTTGQDEVRHLYLAQLYLSMSDLTTADKHLHAAFAAGKQHVRTLFSGQLWALRGNLHRIRGDYGAALGAHEHARRDFRHALAEEGLLQTAALLGISPDGVDSKIVDTALSPIDVLIGGDHMLLGNFVKAERQLSQALTAMQRPSDKSHPLLPLALAQKSMLHLAKGESRQALTLAKEAEKAIETLRRGTVGGAHLRDQIFLDVTMILAQVYLATSRPADAQIDEAVRRSGKLFGPLHAYSLTARVLAASRDEAAGKRPVAIAAMREVVNDSVLVYGKETAESVAARNNLAMMLSRDGKLDEAFAELSLALEHNHVIYGDQHPTHWTMLNNMAGILKAKGQANESLKLYRDAMRELERAGLKESPDYATALANLGILEMEMDRTKTALPRFRQALRLREKLLPKTDDEYSLAIAHTNMAVALNDLGDLKAALKHGLKAVEIGERVHGKLHERYIGYLNNLASIYDVLGRPKDAQEKLDEAAALNKEMGEKVDSYDTREQKARLLNNKGYLAKTSGRNEAALALYLEARAAARAAGVPGSSDLAVTIDANIAGELYSLKRDAEARAEATQTLAKLEQKFRGRHSQVAEMRWILGELDLRGGHLKSAISHLQAAADYFRKGGEHSVVYYTTLFTLARAYQQAEDVAGELAIRQEHLTVGLAKKGPEGEHEALWARFNLADRLQALGRRDEAYEQWNTIVEAKLGASVLEGPRSLRFVVLTAIFAVAERLHGEGAHPAEQALWRRSIQLAKDGKDVSRLGHSHERLGECLIRQKQFDGAREIYSAGVATLESMQNDDPNAHARLLWKLGELAANQQEPAKAVALFRKALAVAPRTNVPAMTRSFILSDLADALMELKQFSPARETAAEAEAVLIAAEKRGDEVPADTIILAQLKLATAYNFEGWSDAALPIARKALERALATTPEDHQFLGEIHRVIAVSLTGAKDLDSAEQSLRKAVDAMARSTKSPQALATTLWMHGRMLQTLKRDDEARIAFERALKVDAPNVHPRAHLGLAQSSADKGAFDKVLLAAQAVLDARDATPQEKCEARLFAAASASRLNRPDDAQKSLGGNLGGQCDEPTTAATRGHMIAMSYKAKRYKEAAAQYDQLTRNGMQLLSPRMQANVRQDAGSALIRLSRTDEALAALAAGADQPVKDPGEQSMRVQLRLQYAALLANLGRAADAESQLTRAQSDLQALAKHPRYAGHLLYSATVYGLLGKLDESRRVEALAERAIPRDAKLDDELRRGQVSARAARSGWRLWGPNAAVLVQACAPEACRSLQPGDVLLRYDGEAVTSLDDFRKATSRGRGPAELELRREGVTMKVTVPRGPLGVEISDTAWNPSRPGK